MSDEGKTYLSFGGGVNSTALMLLMIDEGMHFESVFCDTGCEFPHTYDYIKMLQARGYAITWLRPLPQGFTLYEYCYHYAYVPSRFRRFCTVKYKTRPFARYVDKPCFNIVGIDAGETNRIKRLKQQYCGSKPDPSIIKEYPLIARGLNRHDCEDIIKAHGLPVPEKSSCWMCLFMNKDRIISMSERYPEYIPMITALEDRLDQRLRNRSNKRLTVFLNGRIEDLLKSKVKRQK